MRRMHHDSEVALLGPRQKQVSGTENPSIQGLAQAHEQSSDQCPILSKQYNDEGTIFGSFSMPLVFTEEYQILHLYKMGLTIIIHK